MALIKEIREQNDVRAGYWRIYGIESLFAPGEAGEVELWGYVSEETRRREGVGARAMERTFRIDPEDTERIYSQHVRRLEESKARIQGLAGEGLIDQLVADQLTAALDQANLYRQLYQHVKAAGTRVAEDPETGELTTIMGEFAGAQDLFEDLRPPEDES